MAITSVASLLDALRQYRLLEREQLDEAAQMQARCPEPRALARELIQRGWLTPYQINQLLQGRGSDLMLGSYVLLERLGEGGMGQVFKARNWKLGRVVALKVIRKDCVANDEAQKRFHREIHAVSQLSHPNVIMAYDADHAGDVHFFAMEYVEGTDLGKWVKDHGPLPVRDACHYVRDAALGLQHAFEKGLVHRDIKPSNLMATTEALKLGDQARGTRVKLMDLGLVSLRGFNDGAAQTLTQEGSVVGTPDYIAPEQARNAHKADIRADLYSLGCTFYFLLSGQPPFGSGTMTEKLLKHHWDTARPIEQLRADVPPAVAAIIRKLMAKKPEERYQTPAQLADALAVAFDPNQATALSFPEALTAEIPFALPVTDPTELNGLAQGGFRRTPGRKRLVIVGSTVAIVLVLLVSLAFRSSRPPTPSDPRGQTQPSARQVSGGLNSCDTLQREQIVSIFCLCEMR
jgi:serine/threonine protein kinase